MNADRVKLKGKGQDAGLPQNLDWLFQITCCDRHPARRTGWVLFLTAGGMEKFYWRCMGNAY